MAPSRHAEVDQPRKKTLVVALDYDGCSANVEFEIGYEVLLKKYVTADQIPPQEYTQLVSESHQKLLSTINEKAEGYDEIMVLTGSNRMSAEKDQESGKKNGSAFRMLRTLASILQKQNDKPVILNKTLLFDFILERHRGFNFDFTEKQELDYNNLTSLFNGGDIKFRTLFYYIQDICAHFPQNDFGFIHFDDRDDIITQAIKVYQDPRFSTVVPSNLLSVDQMQYQNYKPFGVLFNLNILAQQQKSILKKPFTPEEIENITTAIERIVATLKEDFKVLIKLGEAYLKTKGEDAKVRDEIERAKTVLKALEEYRLTPSSRQETVEEKTQKLFKDIDDLNRATRTTVQPKNLPDQLRLEYESATLKNHPLEMDFFSCYQKPRIHEGFIIHPTVFPYIVTTTFRDTYIEELNKDFTVIQKISDLGKGLSAAFYLLEEEERLRQRDMALDLTQLFKRQRAIKESLDFLTKNWIGHQPQIKALKQRWKNLPKPSWFDCFTYVMSDDPKNLWRDAFLFPKNNGSNTGYGFKVAGYWTFIALGGFAIVPLRFAYKALVETTALWLENKINHGLATLQRKITIHKFDRTNPWDWLNHGGSMAAYIAGGLISYALRSVRVLSRAITSPIRSATVGYNTGSEVHRGVGIALAFTSGLVSLGAYIAGFYYAIPAGLSALTATGITYAAQAAAGIKSVASVIMSAFHLGSSVTVGAAAVQTEALVLSSLAVATVGVGMGAREAGGRLLDPACEVKQPNQILRTTTNTGCEPAVKFEGTLEIVHQNHLNTTAQLSHDFVHPSEHPSLTGTSNTNGEEAKETKKDDREGIAKDKEEDVPPQDITESANLADPGALLQLSIHHHSANPTQEPAPPQENVVKPTDPSNQ